MKTSLIKTLFYCIILSSCVGSQENTLKEINQEPYFTQEIIYTLIKNGVSSKTITALSNAMFISEELSNKLWPNYCFKEQPICIMTDSLNIILGLDSADSTVFNKEVRFEIIPEKLYKNKPIYKTNKHIIPLAGQVTLSINRIAVCHIANYEKYLQLLTVEPYKTRVVRFGLPSPSNAMYLLEILHEGFHAYHHNKVYSGFFSAPSLHYHQEAICSERLKKEDLKKEVHYLIELFEYNESKLKEELQNYIDFHDKIRQQLSKDEIESENYWTWQEGIAIRLEFDLVYHLLNNRELISVVSTEEFINHLNQYQKARYELFQRNDFVRDYFWNYEIGYLQTTILDKLMPNWKERANNKGVYLIDLLKEIVKES